MPRPTTETYSIFGQIEAAAAEHMLANGKAMKIPAKEIPASVATSSNGEPAMFAVRIPREHIEEFERTITNLRM